MTLRNHFCYLADILIAMVQDRTYNNSHEELTAISETTKIFHIVPLGGGGETAGVSPLAAYRVTYTIITQFSNGAIELVQLAALISALHFHSLAAARVLQSGIPWEISSYFPWLKQTYIQLTEHAGMKLSGLGLLNTTVCTMITQTVRKSSDHLTRRACSRNVFAIF